MSRNGRKTQNMIGNAVGRNKWYSLRNVTLAYVSEELSVKSAPRLSCCSQINKKAGRLFRSLSRT